MGESPGSCACAHVLLSRVPLGASLSPMHQANVYTDSVGVSRLPTAMERRWNM